MCIRVHGSDCTLSVFGAMYLHTVSGQPLHPNWHEWDCLHWDAWNPCLSLCALLHPWEWGLSSNPSSSHTGRAIVKERGRLTADHSQYFSYLWTNHRDHRAKSHSDWLLGLCLWFALSNNRVITGIVSEPAVCMHFIEKDIYYHPLRTTGGQTIGIITIVSCEVVKEFS